jgi:predicted ABC-type sugar transport system permease subunit
MLLPYICCAFAVVVALFVSLGVLGVRDCVRGVASRNWSTVARGVALLIAAVATVIVSHNLWLRWIGVPWP